RLCVIVALAQINPIVGDIAGNSARVRAWLGQAREARADVVLFPELVIPGYPPKDLLYKPDFIEANTRAVHEIAQHCDGLTAIVGFAEANKSASGRSLFNSAAVCRDGVVSHIHRKSLLPTYDVFDESRYFEPGSTPDLESMTLGGHPAEVGVTICEDLWNE